MRATRSEKLDLRLTPEAKQLIAAAAASERRSVGDFVLDSALTRASEALADRRSFHLDSERWAAFVEALDAPVRDMPAMRRLLDEPGIFAAKKPA